MEQTKIEWTNTYLDRPVLWKKELTTVIPGASFNPWWGCEKVSPGCKHCYAENLSDKRLGYKNWGPGSERLKFMDKHWNEPLNWNSQCAKLGIRRKVFCASMADVFENNPSVVLERARLYELIQRTPFLDWLLLTKRPENIIGLMPFYWKTFPENVWIGTTTENQQTYNLRVPILEQVPAVIHFLSMEPLLSAVDMQLERYHQALDWVIVGGESGSKARPMEERWVQNILTQCEQYRVKFFFKQWGGQNKKEAGRELNGRFYNQMPGNYETAV